MLVAQISDLHVGATVDVGPRRVNAAEQLGHCIASILRLAPRPDVVVASGDLVEAGTAAEYRRLRELLAPLPMPVYLMPGNHDDRASLRAEFRDHVYLPTHGTLHYAIETHAMRLIMLDTLVPGMDAGTVNTRQLEWLSATLAAAPDTPTHIFMHHPPIMTGIRCMDEIAVDAQSAARLRSIVERNAQVERVSCGHVHRTIETRWRTAMVGICPSTAFQGILDLREDATDAATDEPPAYQAHYWNGMHLITHTVQISV